jgi:hypothetical protein
VPEAAHSTGCRHMLDIRSRLQHRSVKVGVASVDVGVAVGTVVGSGTDTGTGAGVGTRLCLY